MSSRLSLFEFMNIKQLSTLVPASFTCQALDDNGEWIDCQVSIIVNRLSFREVSQEQFQEALKNADKDPEVLGELLRKGLHQWDLFTDEANTERLPITVENIIDRPVDFTMNLATAVMEKLFANPPKAASSANGSAPADVLASAARTLKAVGDSQPQADIGE